MRGPPVRIRRGMGKPGFPIPLRKGCALPDPPAGGGMGEPGSPMFTLAVALTGFGYTAPLERIGAAGRAARPTGRRTLNREALPCD